MPTSLSRAVTRAVAGAPGTLRAVARGAKVPASTLARIGTGEREATPAVARAVAQALRQWARDCEQLAERIEKALPERRG